MAAVDVGDALVIPELVEVGIMAVRHALHRAVEVPQVGLYDGRGGIALAALRVGLRVHDATLTGDGRDLLDACVDIDPSGSDLIGGWNGMALAFLRGDEITNGTRWRDAALEAGHAAVARARRRSWGWEWPDDPGDHGDRGLCGLAHGASGAVLALSELAAATGVPDFDEAIAGALQFEHSWFDRTRNDWPDLRDGTSYPSVWCHGGTGIGMARLAAFGHTRHPRLAAEAAAAVQSAHTANVDALTTGDLQHGLTMCHGLGGRLDLFIEAFRVFGDDALLASARSSAVHALQFLGDDIDGWPSGHRQGRAPGLMNGRAGTLHVLAQLIDPHRLPGLGTLTTGPTRHGAR